jgi:hypothetical protein
LKSNAISLIRRWKEALWIKSVVDFWYLWILQRAMVPGQYWWGFSHIVASCLHGTFPQLIYAQNVCCGPWLLIIDVVIDVQQIWILLIDQKSICFPMFRSEKSMPETTCN